MSAGSVLHLLSQRPLLTGSGVTLDRLVAAAAAAGWSQTIVVGVPADAPDVAVGGLRIDALRPLRFATRELPFELPGMSDVMPYPSTVYSSMTDAQWAAYRAAWEEHLRAVGASFHPDVVHTHHVWLLSSLAKGVFSDSRVVVHCHATGLRQLRTCPTRGQEIRAGAAQADAFVVLHEGMAEDLVNELGVDPRCVHVVGAGYRDELFTVRTEPPDNDTLLFVGKYAQAKGLPYLLEAFEAVIQERPGVRLHVAGSGVGPEAAALRSRMQSLAPHVVLHGQLDQAALAALMGRCAVFVLPSLYEGLPLVLVEAAASGCRLVATELPAVRQAIAPHLGDRLDLVAMPPMATIDKPRAAAIPGFVKALTASLRTALAAGPARQQLDLRAFRWSAVFDRVQEVWTA